MDDESVSLCSSGGAWSEATRCTVVCERLPKTTLRGPSAVSNEILKNNLTHMGTGTELDHDLQQVRQCLDELRLETHRARSEARNAMALAEELQRWVGSVQDRSARSSISHFKTACEGGTQSEYGPAWLFPTCCSATLRVQELQEELSLVLARLAPLEAEMTLVTHFRTRLESLEATPVRGIQSRVASIEQRLDTEQRRKGSLEELFARPAEHHDGEGDELERPFCPPAAVCRARLSVSGLPEIECDLHTRVQTLEHRAAIFEPSLLWLRALREQKDVAKHHAKRFSNEMHQRDPQTDAVFDVDKAVCRFVASRESLSH